MITSKHFEDADLLKLLRSRSETGEREMLSHVESCESCQSKLETLSQGGMTWRDVTDLLAPRDSVASELLTETAADDSDVTMHATSRLLSPSQNPKSLGTFGRYEVMELLGRGGMGIVMRGYDPSLNRHSAVKVLAPELASSAAARRRFSREAKSAAAVVHPHVVPIHTVDEHEGLPYLVMPVVEGSSLEDRVRNSGPLAIIEAVRIAAQIANGLGAAHEQGLVHRDIKPANILLENGVERVQITDFGLARAIDDASMTRSGVIAGTPQYMSPEQAHGDAIDHRSDLFSLGSLIYFMVTGHSPFRAETTMGVLNRIGHDQPRSIRSINADAPSWLEQIVFKLLEKAPSNRFQTATEVADLLEAWLAHLQQPTTTPAPKYPAPDTKSTKRPWTWLAVSATLLASATVAMMADSVGGNNSDEVDLSKATTPRVNSEEEVALTEETSKKAQTTTIEGLTKSEKVLWKAPLGSQTMRAPVVHGDQIYIGTNNEHGYISRFPSKVDLGVLLCFRKSDGEFLWQHSNQKLDTGRAHDWPLQGITSRPCVSGDRLWYVTNRGEIVCLDTQGFRDGENDGIVQDEPHTDLNEADVVWRFDMMKELGVQPHNVSTCTVALWENQIFAVTGHGVGPTHVPPLAEAPSFISVDKTTGKLLWQDDSPGQNILHGQWGSPTVLTVKGKTQVVFPGGDGWLYSFDPKEMPEGNGRLIWKFDCNPKESGWTLGGRGTRNNLLHGPTAHKGLLYIAMGQDPEHGGGPGRLWCIDPAGRGDVSAEMVYNTRNPTSPREHRRVQACVAKEGDFTAPNSNSRAIWQFEQQDVNGNGKFELHEQLSRSLSTIAIKDDLLFVSDIEGFLHCLDRRTGKQHWAFDTYASVYTTPLIVGERVFLGTEDGEILVFGTSADPKVAMPNDEPLRRIQCDTSVNASVIADEDILYFTTRNEIIAVKDQEASDR